MTGGSSGIGLAMAEVLASRGMDIAVIARDFERLEAAREAAALARRDEAQTIAAYSCDVSSREEVEATVARVESELGPIDLLVTCAGFCTPVRFAEAPASDFDEHVGTNLMGTIWPARCVVPGMIERGRGHIAMVSSMGGYLGIYGYSAYSPSKFGVMGLAEVLRCELKPHGIGVSVLFPPNVDTPGYAREIEIEPPETAKINSTTKAVPPRAMAEALVKAIERGRFLVLPGLLNKLAYRAKGLVPGLLFAMFDSDVRTVRRRAAREETKGTSDQK